MLRCYAAAQRNTLRSFIEQAGGQCHAKLPNEKDNIPEPQQKLDQP